MMLIPVTQFPLEFLTCEASHLLKCLLWKSEPIDSNEISVFFCQIITFSFLVFSAGIQSKPLFSLSHANIKPIHLLFASIQLIARTKLKTTCYLGFRKILPKIQQWSPFNDQKAYQEFFFSTFCSTFFFLFRFHFDKQRIEESLSLCCLNWIWGVELVLFISHFLPKNKTRLWHFLIWDICFFFFYL